MATDWETCKENYVPVREGRKPTLLSPSPAKPGSQLEEARKSVQHGWGGMNPFPLAERAADPLLLCCRKFWAEVGSAAHAGDPLEPWLR
jgi:hypothetical protein